MARDKPCSFCAENTSKYPEIKQNSVTVLCVLSLVLILLNITFWPVQYLRDDTLRKQIAELQQRTLAVQNTGQKKCDFSALCKRFSEESEVYSRSQRSTGDAYTTLEVEKMIKEAKRTDRDTLSLSLKRRIRHLRKLVDRYHEESGPQLLHMHAYSNSTSSDENVKDILRIWREQTFPEFAGEPSFVSTHNLKDKGSIRVKERGLYLIYAQIHFTSAALHHAVGLFSKYSNQSLSSCVISERYTLDPGVAPHDVHVYLPCSMTIIQFFEAGDDVYLKNLFTDRKILMKKEFTYWGILRLSNLKTF